MRKVILADNQFITSTGLKSILKNTFMLNDVCDKTFKNELITELKENDDVLVIVDYVLFDFESNNDLIILQQRFQNSHWLIFSDNLSPDFVKTLVFNSESFSIVLKNCSQEEITLALKQSLNGNRYICNELSNMLLTSKSSELNRSTEYKLTATELEILKEMALGKSTKEIAACRFLSIHTVMTHRKNIFRKIEVNTVHEATKYAMRAGIVDLAEYYI